MPPAKNVMIIEQAAPEHAAPRPENSPEMSGYRAACFIDDDKPKSAAAGRVKVVGDTKTIAENVKSTTYR